MHLPTTTHQRRRPAVRHTIALLIPLLVLVGCGGPSAHATGRPTSAPFAVVAATTAIPAPPAPPTLTLAPASTATAIATPTSISRATRQQILTEVWTTVAENYLYADFHGLDWAAVRAEFMPLVDAAASDEEFYRLLGEMVRRLDDNHSRVLAPSAAQREDVLSSGREEQVGIGVSTLPLADALLIQHVFPGSPAERAGLRARDRIVAVDGASYARRDIDGPAGTQVRLTVVRPGETSRDMVITRRLVEGQITPQVRMLPDNVGYLAITTLWVHTMDELSAAALAQLSHGRRLNGLIIDLRRNPGGWRDVLVGLLGHFVRGSVGTFFSRQGDAPLTIGDGAAPDLRGVPLVVLVDGGTASYAELLAGILQHEAGALVVGAPSAGNTETIYSYALTGGARLWVAQEGFRLRDGENLEGRGVQPDQRLSADWTRYSEDDDPWILEGLRLIRAGLDGK
jgi:C-terminal peptidase prc